MKRGMDMKMKHMESFDAMATFREQELRRREVELDGKEVHLCVLFCFPKKQIVFCVVLFFKTKARQARGAPLFCVCVFKTALCFLCFVFRNES